MSTATNQNPELKFRSFGEFMDKCMQTLMHLLDQKIDNPKSFAENLRADGKLDKHDTIDRLIQLLPQQRQFALYRTEDLTHDQFLVHWREIEDLHVKETFYVYRLKSGDWSRLKKSVEYIRGACLWGYIEGGRGLSPRESKTIRETQKALDLV